MDLAIERVERNPKSVYLDAMVILMKLLENVIDNPKEEKYRKIKTSNKRISQELLSCEGMIELLNHVGFKREGDEFILKGGLGVISKLKTFRETLQGRMDDIKRRTSSGPGIAVKNPTTVSTGAIQKIIPITKPVQIKSNKTFRERITFTRVLQTDNNFLVELEQLSDSVMQYEDQLLQESALKLVPVERFKQSAIEKLRKFQKLIQQKKVADEEPPLTDLILEELALWFKNEFFTWINQMPCKICKSDKTSPAGSTVENGVRVEKFICCNTVTKFARYNDIEKLLVTRSGRCGEFANCFTFLCRCLKYDARYVYSTSDHVWTEVYSHAKKRWIHIDPSENVFDSPLMYEHGWKRQLDYVLAFSHDDIQDVSWRYSNKHQEMSNRRKLCTENELLETIMDLRKKRQIGVSPARKKFLLLRTFSELGELLIIREPTENELKGRSSGSLSWRLERGEANISNFYVFKPSTQEQIAKQFNVRYSCAKDVYERFISSSEAPRIFESIKEWKSCLYSSENIFRKVEHDHKMAYLSRNEESSTGMIQWKFDFSDMTIKTIDLKLETKTFHSGNIKMELLDISDNAVSSKQLIGANKFSIRIKLSGGEGDCAWQHAQVFRESLNSHDFPFQLSINFN